jgi:gamma-glutamylcyclotransferase (GGCT)/AIG2-like uncharacterized protein YtfP
MFQQILALGEAWRVNRIGYVAAEGHERVVNGSVLSIDTNAWPAIDEALWRGSCEWNMAGRFTM